jgi:hypothetical protein
MDGLGSSCSIAAVDVHPREIAVNPNRVIPSADILVLHHIEELNSEVEFGRVQVESMKSNKVAVKWLWSSRVLPILWTATTTQATRIIQVVLFLLSDFESVYNP